MDTVDYAEKLFEELETLTAEIARLSAAKKAVEADIQAYVETNGNMKCRGYIAEIKRGNNSLNHEQAARDHGVTDELITMFTGTPQVAWAKVTAKMKLDMKPYTTPGELVFSLSREKK